MLTDEQVKAIERVAQCVPFVDASVPQTVDRTQNAFADLLAERRELLAEVHGYRNGARVAESKIAELERAITCVGGPAGCLNADHECWTCFSERLAGELRDLADTAETCVKSNGIVDDVLEEAIAAARKILEAKP